MTNQHNDAMSDSVQQLLESGKLQEALGLCRQLCRADDSQPEDWLLYGCLSADLGDSPAARMALEKAVMLAPDFVEARFALGKLLAASDPESAIVQFEKAAQLQPDNAEIWLALGVTCGLAKQVTKAEQYCRRSLAVQPESAQARFNLANALQAQGKLSDAEAEYEATLRIIPGQAEAWSMLAQARLGLRHFDEAEAAANHALKLNPRMGEAYFTLGVIADELDDTRRARDYFRKAVELLPEFLDAHWRLGQSLMGLKEYAAAADSFQIILNADPGLSKAHIEMGNSFYQRKMYGRAENCFRKAIALNNDDIIPHTGLALTLKGMNRTDEYEMQLVECQRVSPNEPQTRHLLATLRGEATDAAPAEYVKIVFDGYADNFEAHLVGALKYQTPERLAEMVGQYLPLTENSGDVIDLGCGTGLCAPLFSGIASTLHGVDLSPRMIEKAREHNLYDTLEVGDIVSSLKSKLAAWDLAISADVLIYIGNLQEVFSACFAALKPGGMFAFSVEVGDDCDTFVLRSSGRYAHASNYIRSLFDETGFQEIERRAVVLRKEANADMQGYLFLARRPLA